MPKGRKNQGVAPPAYPRPSLPIRGAPAPCYQQRNQSAAGHQKPDRAQREIDELVAEVDKGGGVVLVRNLEVNKAAVGV
jgi:hypothetical protein